MFKKIGQRLRADFSILLFSVLVVLLMGEICVRIFLPQTVESPMNYFASDSLLGWRLKPNLHKLYTNPDFKMEVVTNENGFRDVYHSYDKGPNTFRILGIGDSFLFGYGVSYNDNLFIRLQELLGSDNALNKKIEMINLAIPSYSINEYYKVLSCEGYKYSPDLVILFFYANDWMENDGNGNKVGIRNGFLVTQERFSFRSLRSFLLPLRVFLKRHSQLYILTRQRTSVLLKKTRLMQLPEVSLYRRDKDLNVGFSHTFELINQINKFCQNNLNCVFMLCLVPEKIQVDESFLNLVVTAYNLNIYEYDWLRPQKFLTDFCSKKNILCLDLSGALLEFKQKEPIYFNTDIHLNSYGHFLSAKEIYRFIKEKAILSN